MTDFPLTKQLGLTVVEIGRILGAQEARSNHRVVSASDLEPIAAKLVEALRAIADIDNIDREDPVRTAYETLKALGVEPIVRDTAEGLLRELVAPEFAWEEQNLREFRGRARKLLEGK